MPEHLKPENGVTELSEIQRQILAIVTPLEDGWRRQGYVPMFGPHHLHALGSDREIRRELNAMVRLGVLRTLRHGRYKVWQTIR